MKKFGCIGVVIAIVGFVILSLFGYGTFNAPPQGQVYLMQLGSTVKGMQNALAGETGTILMAKDNFYLFGWAVKDSGWAFTVYTSNGSNISLNEFAETLSKANLINSKDAFDLVNFLEGKGWDKISSDSVPSAIRDVLAMSYSAMASNMARAGNISVYFIPIYTLQLGQNAIYDYLNNIFEYERVEVIG